MEVFVFMLVVLVLISTFAPWVIDLIGALIAGAIALVSALVALAGGLIMVACVAVPIMLIMSLF